MRVTRVRMEFPMTAKPRMMTASAAGDAGQVVP